MWTPRQPNNFAELLRNYVGGCKKYALMIARRKKTETRLTDGRKVERGLTRDDEVKKIIESLVVQQQQEASYKN